MEAHCLEQSGVHVPDTVTFVSVDFEQEELMVRLAASGFDAGAPAFCSWLGVLPYLTREAAVGTLRALGALPAGSGVAFDYAVARESLSPKQQAMFDWLAERVARGESRSGWDLIPSSCASSCGSAVLRGWRIWTVTRSVRSTLPGAGMGWRCAAG